MCWIKTGNKVFIISANNIWKFSVSTFILRKNSKLDIILESFKEEIPNNFQTFSKNRRFEDTLRKTSKETPYIEIQSIGIILEIQNSNFRNNFGKSVLPKSSQNSYKVWKDSIFCSVTRLNACSSGISIATGISSVATFATFVGLPVSISLGAASLTGAIASGIISTLN